MSEAEQLIGYCLKCKEKRTMLQTKAEWATNGSPATRGVCSVCGGNVYKRGHTPAHDNLPKPDPATRPPKKRKKKRASAKRKKKSAAPVRRSGKLVVVESPAKARTIGRYLGRGYKVKSSVGHVRDLLRSRLSVDVDNDFAPEYRVPNDKRAVVKELKEAAAKAKEIYLATDPDREGEAIAWHVLESAEMDASRAKRVVFQEVTKTAVQKAMEKPRDIDMQRVNAQQARRILDRLVGYKLSPLLWRKVQRGLSAGRVQSVAVRLIVERERAIEAFTPTEYWHILANLRQMPAASVPFTAKLHRFQKKELTLSSEDEVKPHLSALQNADWQVGKVKLGSRRRRPAAPFTTSSMQQDASRRLRFGASKTMRVAQQLYEGVAIGSESTGLITYMRTDSVKISKEAQAAARGYIQAAFGAEYVPEKPPIYKTRSKAAQEAHEAVRPTDVQLTPKRMKEFLTRDQYRLYKLIWERFVASQMSSAVYDTVSVDIYAGDASVPALKRPYQFRAAGSTLRFKGFLALYEEAKSEDAQEKESEDSIVPSSLQQEEQLTLLKLIPEQHFTQPPPRFSEATLVKEMEEYEIGRPSTYASIISTIQSRNYVYSEKRRLAPTETGMVVNDLLVKYFPDVLSIDFTARLENLLDEIAEGKQEWAPVLHEFYAPFVKKLEIAEEAIPKQLIAKEVEPVGRDCPESGHPLLYREGRYGRFIGCSNFPKCRYTEQILIKTGVTCPQDGGDIIEKKTKRGRTFFGCHNYPDCDWTSWKRPLTQPCRQCGGVIVQLNKESAECTNCGDKQPIIQIDTAPDLEAMGEGTTVS